MRYQMKTIIVIDDDKIVTDIFDKALSNTNYNYKIFNSSLEGLSHIQKNSVDLVITDIFMPEKDGYEVIVEIKKYQKDIKILCVSSGSKFFKKDMILDTAKRIGADKVLQKPFTINEFQDQIASLLKD